MSVSVKSLRRGDISVRLDYRATSSTCPCHTIFEEPVITVKVCTYLPM